MNSEDLNDLWPYAWRPVEAGDATLASTPDGWASIVAAETATRLSAFHALAQRAFENMPMTLGFVTDRVTDAYLVSTDEAGIALIVDFEDKGNIVSYCSSAPKGTPRFIGRLGDFYAVMDGFVDLMFFGGPLPQDRLEPLSAHADFYEWPPSSDAAKRLKHRPYLRIFNNGASGYAYIDAATAGDDDPNGLVLWTDDDEPMIDKPFWSLIDSWTFIAMGGG